MPRRWRAARGQSGPGEIGMRRRRSAYKNCTGQNSATPRKYQRFSTSRKSLLLQSGSRRRAPDGHPRCRYDLHCSKKAQQQCSVFQSCTDRKNALQVAAEKGAVKHRFRGEKAIACTCSARMVSRTFDKKIILLCQALQGKKQERKRSLRPQAEQPAAQMHISPFWSGTEAICTTSRPDLQHSRSRGWPG